MCLSRLADRAMSLTYRLAGLALLYLVDDAAILAMMFC